MIVHLCIPHAPVELPGGRVVKRKIVNRFKLRWTSHHPQSHYGIGVLLDLKGEIFDGHQFRHLRDSVGAWIESEDAERTRVAMGLPSGERLKP